MSERILITGGSGFLGTNLVEHYVGLGRQVFNLDASAPRNSRHRAFWQECDVTNAARLRELVTEIQPDLVLHMAARTDLAGKTLADYDTNIGGVRNLLDAMDDVNSIRRVLFCSSMLVCRLGYRPNSPLDYCPDTVYGESKVAGEALVHERNASRYSWAIVRPTSIWGPWFGPPYRAFFDMVRKGLYVHPGDRKVLRTYGFVLNCVAQIGAIAAAEQASGGTYYLGDYHEQDVKLWADEISVRAGGKPIRRVPVPFFAVAGRVGDMLRSLGWRNPPMTSFRLRNMLTPAVYDLSNTRELCPELPYTMARGVQMTLDWIGPPGCGGN